MEVACTMGFPRMHNLKHLTIRVRGRQIQPSWTASLAGLPLLESLALTAKSHVFSYHERTAMQAGPLKLAGSRRLAALYLCCIMPVEVTVPPGCCVRFGGYVSSLIRHWDSVRQLCSECAVYTWADGTFISVACLMRMQQPCPALNKLCIRCLKAEIGFATGRSPFRVGQPLAALQQLDIFCKDLTISFAACLRLRRLVLNVRNALHVSFENVATLPAALEEAHVQYGSSSPNILLFLAAMEAQGKACRVCVLRARTAAKDRLHAHTQR